jgi:transposase
LRALGAGAGRAPERGDDVAGAAPPGLAAPKKSLAASERDEAARAAWRAEVAALDPAACVFVAESGTHTSLTRLRARAPRGERAVAAVPRNHGPNVTLFAALTPAGIGPALAMEGAADGAAFALYVRELLVPSLRPGQVVIMDQLSVHKGAAVREAIEAADCRLLLRPAYSPDCTPIEQAFAKIKGHLRTAAARTFDDLVAAIGAALDTVTPAAARGCFDHCGYRLPHQLL